MTTTEAYPRLLEALGQLRRQWHMQKLLEGTLLALAGTVGILLMVVAADKTKGKLSSLVKLEKFP